MSYRTFTSKSELLKSIEEQVESREQMDFSQALLALREGKRVTNKAWNGANQWLCYMPATTIPEDLVNGRTKKFFPSGDLSVGGYFVMFTSKGVWQPGWLASQADLLSDAWEVVLDGEDQ